MTVKANTYEVFFRFLNVTRIFRNFKNFTTQKRADEFCSLANIIIMIKIP
jgi:hypothetical protein